MHWEYLAPSKLVKLLAKKHNVTPLARIMGYFVSGCDPSIMDIGLVSTVNEAVNKTRLNLKEMEMVEVNEIFAL